MVSIDVGQLRSTAVYDWSEAKKGMEDHAAYLQNFQKGVQNVQIRPPSPQPGQPGHPQSAIVDFEKLAATMRQGSTVMGEFGMGSEKVGLALGTLEARSLLAGAGIAGAAIVVTIAADKFLSLGISIQAADDKLAALTGLSTDSVGKLADGLSDVGAKFGYNREEMTKAFTQVAPLMQATNGGVLDYGKALDSANEAAAVAKVTGQDLGGVWKGITDTSVTFGTSAKETGDILMKSSEVSGQSVESLGDQFGRMHDRLGNAAPSLKDASALMYEFQKSGVSGQRGMMQATGDIETMMGGTKSSVEEFNRLSISIRNSDGSLRSFSEVFPELLSKMQGMSEEQKQWAEEQLVGAGNARQLDAIISGGLSGWEDAQKAISTNSDALQQYATSSDNAAGAWDRLKAKIGSGIGGAADQTVQAAQNIVAPSPSRKDVEDYLSKHRDALIKQFGEDRATDLTRLATISTSDKVAAAEKIGYLPPQNPEVSPGGGAVYNPTTKQWDVSAVTSPGGGETKEQAAANFAARQATSGQPAPGTPAGGGGPNLDLTTTLLNQTQAMATATQAQTAYATGSEMVATAQSHLAEAIANGNQAEIQQATAVASVASALEAQRQADINAINTRQQAAAAVPQVGGQILQQQAALTAMPGGEKNIGVSGFSSTNLAGQAVVPTNVGQVGQAYQSALQDVATAQQRVRDAVGDTNIQMAQSALQGAQNTASYWKNAFDEVQSGATAMADAVTNALNKPSREETGIGAGNAKLKYQELQMLAPYEAAGVRPPQQVMSQIRDMERQNLPNQVQAGLDQAYRGVLSAQVTAGRQDQMGLGEYGPMVASTMDQITGRTPTPMITGAGPNAGAQMAETQIIVNIGNEEIRNLISKGIGQNAAPQPGPGGPPSG